MFDDDIVGKHLAKDVELLSLGCMDFGEYGAGRSRVSCLEGMLSWCRQNGYDIGSDRLFDCRWMIRYDYPSVHVNTCTGQNWDIFTRVWHHPNMPALLTRVLRSYGQHILTRPGESYKVVFYCMHGEHEPVAAIVGLRAMFLANYKTTAKVRMKMRKCGTRDLCQWCYNYHDRKAWELDVIESVLDRLGTMSVPEFGYCHTAS